MIDLAFVLLAGLCQAAMAYWGVKVAIDPPEALRKHELRKLKIFFACIGVTGFAAFVAAAVRSSDVQNETHDMVSKLTRGTADENSYAYLFADLVGPKDKDGGLPIRVRSNGAGILKSVSWHVIAPGTGTYGPDYLKYLNLGGVLAAIQPETNNVLYEKVEHGLVPKTIKPGIYQINFATDSGGWTEQLVLRDDGGRISEAISVTKNGKVLMPEHHWP